MNNILRISRRLRLRLQRIAYYLKTLLMTFIYLPGLVIGFVACTVFQSLLIGWETAEKFWLRIARNK